MAADYDCARLCLISARIRHRPEVRRWVEKTPTNERFLGDIWREYPEARVVHVVSDPLAVMASRKVMEERATGQFGAFRTALGQLADSYRIADVERARPESTLADTCSSASNNSSRIRSVPSIALAHFLGWTDLPILHRPTSGGIFTDQQQFIPGLGECGTIDRIARARHHGRAVAGRAAATRGCRRRRGCRTRIRRTCVIHYRSHRAKWTHRRRALRARRSQPDRRSQSESRRPIT